MTRIHHLAVALAAIGCGAGVQAATADTTDLEIFRQTYQELVEINTTLSAGDCTAASRAMARRLTDAGLPESDVQVIVAPDFPKQGNLVAAMKGSDRKRKPILLLAHIDVVEAKREDWARDPFKLIEENGYFYARGANDDKAMAAAFVDSLVRYRKAGYRPKRNIKLALTCGEETDSHFNGVRYLLEHHRELIDAQFALNEGGRGQLDEQGNRMLLGIQVGEKLYQDFALETTSPGGHSARPGKDNAIVRLANGLSRLGAFEFPANVGEVTKAYFLQTATTQSDPRLAADLKAAAQAAPDAAALARVSAHNPFWNAMIRTTCVSTLIEGGHAPNALPQRARANVNCRILPGEKVDDVQAAIVRALADPSIAVKADDPAVVAPAPPLTAQILNPARQAAAKLWPGVPLVPSLSTGATDGRFLNAAGLPTYGMSGMFIDPDGGGVHGLNERIRVRSLYEGRQFLHDVVKLYADQ